MLHLGRHRRPRPADTSRLVDRSGTLSALRLPCLSVCLLHACVQALSSPLGAAILAKLDSKQVELVMGAALLLIILGEQASKLGARCRRDSHRQQQQQQTGHGASSAVVSARSSGSSGSSGSSSHCASPCMLMPLPDSPDAAAAATHGSEAAAAAKAADCTVSLPDGPYLPSSSRAASKQSSRLAFDWDYAPTAAAAQHPRDQGSYESLEVEQQQLLLGGSDNSSSSDSRNSLAAGPGRPSNSGVSSSSSGGGRGWQSRRGVLCWRSGLSVVHCQA